MIFMVPWNWAPNSYQLCQGQTIPLQQYEALYSLMGTVFGGNGTTTFLLPNLQGRAPVGTGQGPGGSYYTLAASGGSELTTLSVNNMPVHNHQASFTPTLGQQIVTIPATTGSLGVTATLPVSTTVPGTAAQLANGATGYLTNATANNGPTNYLRGPYSTTAPVSTAQANLPVTTNVTGSAGSAASTVTLNTVTGGSVAVGQSGASTPFSTLQPFLAMSFVIAMNGLYPDRP
jgi:microcystin-dependent protein